MTGITIWPGPCMGWPALRLLQMWAPALGRTSMMFPPSWPAGKGHGVGPAAHLLPCTPVYRLAAPLPVGELGTGADITACVEIQNGGKAASRHIEVAGREGQPHLPRRGVLAAAVDDNPTVDRFKRGCADARVAWWWCLGQHRGGQGQRQQGADKQCPIRGGGGGD